MRFRVFVLLISVLICSIKPIHAQTFEEWLEQEQRERSEFSEKEKADYRQFVKERDESIKKMDDEFADFLRNEWKNYHSQENEYKPEVPKPDAKPVYSPDQKTPVRLIVDSVETIESCLELPHLPFFSKSENGNFDKQNTSSDFYGNDIRLNYDSQMNIRVDEINELSISKMWNKLCNTNYSCTINGLFSWQNRICLNDWGYFLLVRRTAERIAADRNSQILLTWFLMTKSGYRARLAFNGDNLYLLLASSNNIYGKPYFVFENQKYYMIDGKADNVYTYDKDFPESRTSLDLNIYKPMCGAERVNSRIIGFEYDGKDYRFNIRYNQNTVNFYNDYPQADIKIYFDAVVGRLTKESLAGALLPVIGGMNPVDATGFLLTFVQAFDYKTDEQQFGREKFFFPDEMFYYQYSDCEDRAVLFAYLVKQFLGLDVVGLNYPGHMATAVCFGREVSGDYVEFGGKQYIVCDPTYIGAPVGKCMPQFAQMGATVIENAVQPNLAERASKLWRIANKYGLYQGNNCNNIAFDGYGDAFLCGYFSGTVDFMGHRMSAIGGTDIFIAKINADNSLGFMYKIGSDADDVANNIILGSDDSFYFSGLFNGEMTVAGQTLKTNVSDAFIAKCSRNGKLEWINQANIGQLDSVSNTFVTHFDRNGKLLWSRTYAESEDFTNYGITVDNEGNPFVAGSFMATSGYMIQSYQSVNVNENTDSLPVASEMSGLLEFVAQLNGANRTLTGNSAQKSIDNGYPAFSTKSPEIYQQLGNVEFIRNGLGIITIRTNDGTPAVFSAIKLDNNSKFRISAYQSGNVQIDFFSGSLYNNGQSWHSLNSVKLYRASGNVTFDYDADHTQFTISVKDMF